MVHVRANIGLPKKLATVLLFLRIYDMINLSDGNSEFVFNRVLNTGYIDEIARSGREQLCQVTERTLPKRQNSSIRNTVRLKE